jgi:pyruvate formate lyase activating enzyme
MDPMGTVFDIKKYALHDGPGIRTTVFLKGCPLNCAWCHNPEGLMSIPEVVYATDRCLGCGSCVETCEAGALRLTPRGVLYDGSRCLACGCCAEVCPAQARELAGRRMSVSQVVDAVLKDQLFYDESGGGVTFSGGEPLHQPDFLLALLEACGGHEIHRCVDTSGQAPWDSFSRIAPHADLFLFDLKHMDGERHRQATGVDNARIIDNLIRLDHLGAAIILRMPLIPGFNDDVTSVGQAGDFIAGLAGVDTLHLLPYHSMQARKYTKFGREYPGRTIDRDLARPVTEVAEQLRGLGLNIEIGG